MNRKINKKVISFIIIILLLILIGSYALFNGFFARTQLYSFPDSTIAVGYPQGWKVAEESTNDVLFESPDDKDKFRSEVDTSIQEIAATDTDSFYMSVERAYPVGSSQTIKGGKIVETERTELGGFSAYKITTDIKFFRSNSKTSGKAYIYIIYIGDKKAFFAIAELHEDKLRDLKVIEKGLNQLSI